MAGSRTKMISTNRSTCILLKSTVSFVLCRTEQHEAVLELSRRLDKNSNPASLQRCADYLASHRHYGAAVDLLVMAGKVSSSAYPLSRKTVTWNLMPTCL